MNKPQTLPTKENERLVRIADASVRARAEADERRRIEAENAANRIGKEKGGRKGPEPTRYGDWEKDGIASDF